ncbi:NUDIX domain-containing protein [Kytococcus sp. Marseille-QA3725]
MDTWHWQSPREAVRRTELEETVDPAELIEQVDAQLAAGARRVEVLLDPRRRDLRRLTMRAGLRTEGTLRAFAGPSPEGDRLLATRLDSDPPRLSREGRLGVLDSALPVKRVIAQGVITDGAGRVLLCELTYKSEWDLPGGMVDPDEGPMDTVVREVAEELGLDMEVQGLLSVNWLPAYRGWSDAVLCVFDLGTHPDIVERARLQPSEIAALHWCTPEQVAQHAAPYVARHLSNVWDGEQVRRDTVYLRDGEPPQR